jgi:hypothetical protein
MNFNQWWKVASSLATGDLIEAAVLAAFGIIGACVALYIAVPLGLGYLKERRAKRLSRKARSKRYVSGTTLGQH